MNSMFLKPHEEHAFSRNGSLASPQAASGVNFAGYLRTESGVGSAARGYIRALRRLGMPLALNDLSDLQTNRSLDRSLPESDAGNPYTISIVCADAELHYAILDHLGESFFRDRYSIAIWAWELPQFPAKWLDRLAFYDEVWVGSSFIANALAPVSPVPIVRIPPALSRGEGSREAGRRALGLEDDEFLFLFVFDFHSHLARKNPEAVIESFKQAFHPREKARLALKFVNESSDPEAASRLQSLAEGHRVTLLSGYWDSSAIDDLMAACDAYVSLHRSEGTGLTIAEAMALGKPVIATDWSGNLDFMDSSNSHPVRYRLVTLDHSVGPYNAGQRWAEPSTEHASELMRRVFDRREEALIKGRAARLRLEEDFGEERVAELLGQRLRAIETRMDLEQFRAHAWQSYRDYRGLTDRLAQVVERVVPADAGLIVVSKGDERLLGLAGRPSCHFPQANDGKYAGYYPADSEVAIGLIECARARGGRFLLLPNTAFWWLEHYEHFGHYLEATYRRVHDDGACIIYDLTGNESGDVSVSFSELDALLEELQGKERSLRQRMLAASEEASSRGDPASRLAAAYEVRTPAAWMAGESQSYDVVLHNRGRETWNADGPHEVRLAICFLLQGTNANEAAQDEQRFSLPCDVAPDSSLRLAISVRAPTAEGTFSLRHRLVKETVTWFKEEHVSAVVVRSQSAAFPEQPDSRNGANGLLPDRMASYRKLVADVRRQLSAAVPPGSIVLVVSKGDESLLTIEGSEGWHFPRIEDGTYAGHYPADSGEAIARLEAARRLGANFLAVPGPSFWWLDFYDGLSEHLHNRYECVLRNKDCILFRLTRRKLEARILDGVRLTAKVVRLTRSLTPRLYVSILRRTRDWPEGRLGS